MSKPHSRPAVDIVREALEHVRYDEHDGYTPRAVAEAFASLEEQYEDLVAERNGLFNTVDSDQGEIHALEEQLETLRNFAEACCEIIERSRNPVEEITKRLDDVRGIAYPASRSADA